MAIGITNKRSGEKGLNADVSGVVISSQRANDVPAVTSWHPVILNPKASLGVPLYYTPKCLTLRQ